MNIFKKLMTAVRGGTREIGEAMVDAQGTRIFEQEIQDANDRLVEAKNELTNVMAEEAQAQRKLQLIKSDIKKHEGFVNEALDKGDESLALDLAGKIADLEKDLAEQAGVVKSYTAHVNKMKDMMHKAERQIKEYERQLTMVKTTESVQRASEAITDSFVSTNSDMLSAKESLERIKQKQEHHEDRLMAAEQLDKEEMDVVLSEKMEKAGVGQEGPDAASVLDRIKSKRK
jgi:phage shock protein A